MTEFEAALREFIMRLRDFDVRLKKAENDEGALDQMVKMIRPGFGFGANPNCVTDFPAICACIPPTITLVDSFYGNCDIVYDPLALAWTGCNIVTLPNNLSCAGPVTFALHYTLTGDNTTSAWRLTTQYKVTNFTTHCPVASICSDATNQSLNLTITLNCSGTSSVSFTVNGTIPATQAWPVFRNVTLSFTLP